MLQAVGTEDKVLRVRWKFLQGAAGTGSAIKIDGDRSRQGPEPRADVQALPLAVLKRRAMDRKLQVLIQSRIGNGYRVLYSFFRNREYENLRPVLRKASVS